MRSIITTHKDANDQRSDATLIAHIAKGENKALDVLMRRYKQRLYIFVYQYLREEESAYDIIQETFLRVYQHADRYKPAYAASTWIYNIALNLCRDHTRRQKLRRWVSFDSKSTENIGGYSLQDIIPDPHGNIDQILEVKQSLHVLHKEIGALPHDLKAALILFHIEGHSQERCAELLGITTKTVETRVYRARKILAKKLANLI